LFQQKHIKMKIFVTGASGFIGSAVTRELVGAGHQVVGLARSDESAKKIRESGADVLIGDLTDLEVLRQGALNADGVIHTGFIHDFSRYENAAAIDKTAIDTMGEALIGTDKPIVVSAGILGLPLHDGFVTEESVAKYSIRFSEAAALALAEKGVHASAVRLSPSVHDKGDHGFVPFIISQARKHGVSAYPGNGTNRWSAVHRLDAATLFRLAAEKAAKGALYNAVGDTGIEIKRVAELIGENLNLPTASLSEEETAAHFEWMSRFIVFDNPATSIKTQELLGWRPKHLGLLEDMQQNYF
jgi:nucleoside-diphosphate-sugar epimerase